MNITWEKLVDKGEAELVGGKLYLAAPLRTFLGQRVGEQMVLTADGEHYFKERNVPVVADALKGRKTQRQSRHTPTPDNDEKAPAEARALAVNLSDTVETQLAFGGVEDADEEPETDPDA